MSSAAVAANIPNDIGVELWALVYHLFSVYARLHRSAHEAFRELCLRTRCSIHTSNDINIHQPHDVIDTLWYKEMCGRYAHTYERVQKENMSKLNEANELISDMYPNGCSVSSFSDTVQTCLAMLSFSVAPVYIERYLQVQTDKIATSHIHKLGKDELQSSITQELILPSFIPVRWWTQDDITHLARAENTSKTNLVRRVGLKVKPPTIVIEYVQTNMEESSSEKKMQSEEQKKTRYRHRRIVLCSKNNTEMNEEHVVASVRGSVVEAGINMPNANEANHVYAPLPSEFTSTTSTTVLARRLAASHDALLSESQFQKLLVKLQQLMRQETMVAGSSSSNGNNNNTINESSTNNANSTGNRISSDIDHNKSIDRMKGNNETNATQINGKSSINNMAGAAAASPSTKVENAKSNESEVSFETMLAKAEVPPSQPTNNKSKNNSATLEVQKADLGLLYRDPERALQNVDLNSADDITLREFKEAMDEKFKRNVLKPGDVGYVYDKRVSVAAPTEKSEWDDDDDNDDDAF